MSHRVQPDLVGRSRKRRSLLAGGAVLGLGAAATLAAWSDDVWVLSSFTTSPFSVEAAVDPDGDDWQKFIDSPGGGLAFELRTSGMLPGDSAYAPLNLRVARGVSSGLVTLADTPTLGDPSGNNANLFNTLVLSLYAVEPGDCNADGTASGDIIGEFEDATLPYGIGADLVTLPSPGEQPYGHEVGICFKVTLPVDAGPGVAGGSADDLVWNLKAEPVE